MGRVKGYWADERELGMCVWWDWADNGRVGLWGTGLIKQGAVQVYWAEKMEGWAAGRGGGGVKVEMGHGGTGLRREVWRDRVAKGGVGRGALTVYIHPGFTN